MSLGARLAGLLALLATSLSGVAGSVWVRGSDQLHEIDSAANRLARTLVVDGGGALASDDGGAWILAKAKLLRFEASSTPAWSLDLAPLLEQPSFLAMDPRARYLWIAGKDAILRLNLADRTTAIQPFAGNDLRAVDAGLDGSLWMLGNKEVWHYSTEGALLGHVDLHPIASSEPKYLAVDSLGSVVWVAGEKSVVGFDPASPATTTLAASLPDTITALALDRRTGSVFVAGNDRLSIFRHDATLAGAVDLKASGIKNVVGLAFDAATSALWAIHDGTASRLTAQGLVVSTVPLAKNPEVIAATPLRLQPTVSILGPADGLLTNNATPPVTIQYGATCSGAPCGFAFTAYEGYRLATLLNGMPSGIAFAYDPSTGRAAGAAVGRLPEGINRLEARVTDTFGNESDPAISQFTIDTVPPRFIALAPADGASVATPSISLTGSLDEAATILLTGEGVSATAQGTSFSFPITLKTGTNAFTISATDAAGNVSSTTVRVTLASGVQVTVTSPLDGATVPSGRLAVTGTFDGPANTGISVNGVAASLFGNRFVAVIAVNEGPHAITVTGRAQGGASNSVALGVTAGAPRPVELDIAPSSGIAPFAVTVRVPTIPDRISARTQIDFDGDGVVDETLYGFETSASYTYTTPGIYNATITLNDYAGGYYTWAIPVVVQDLDALDLKLRGILSGMFDRLRARDIDGALAAWTADGAERYRPIFESMAGDLPAVVDKLGRIAGGSLTTNLAEYVIIRDGPAGKQAFLAYLMRGADGVWRITQM